LPRVPGYLPLLASALLLATPASASGLGAQNSPPFELYLGAGFVRDTSGTAGLSGANSPPFALDLSRIGSGDSPAYGVHGANSSAFAVYLGRGFAPLPTGPFSSGANSSQFALQLARLRQAIANSSPFPLDVGTFQSPGIPPPYGLTATRDPICGTAVKLSWNYGTESITGFEVESKVTDAPGATFVRIVPLDPDNRELLNRPDDGLRRTYRVRALRDGAASAYSEEVIGPWLASVGSSAPPASVFAKSIGDSTGILVHVMPPGSAQWDGTSSVEVQQFSQPGWNPAHLEDTETKTFPAGTSEGTVRFAGTHGASYWFRARVLKPCTLPSAYTNDVDAVRADYAPVILVHGIYNDSTVWGPTWDDALLAAGFTRQRYAKITLEKCGDTWLQWGKQLARHVLSSHTDQRVGRWPRDERVDIIAYSQGGLASRYLIERAVGANKFVRTLVMVATPNHGGNLATLSNLLGSLKRMHGISTTFCSPSSGSIGTKLLRANSRELRWLNFDDVNQSDGHCETSPLEVLASRKGRVEYYTIAGTGPSVLDAVNYTGECWNQVLSCLWSAANGDLRSACAGDGIVNAQSVYLRAIPADHQFTDVDIGAPGAVHSRGLEVTGQPILESHEVATWALGLLRRQNAQDQASADEAATSVKGFPVPATTEEPSIEAERSTQAAAVADSFPGGLSLLAAYSDTLAGGVRALYDVATDSCQRLVVFTTWADSLLELRLRGPDSTFYLPADTAALAWLHFTTDSLLWFSSFAIDSPQAGRWALEVRAPSHIGTSAFDVAWVTIGADLRIAGSLSTDLPTPGDTVLVRASLRRDGALVTGTFTAEVVAAGGGGTNVSLSDDGLNGDESPADGLYSGRYVVPAIDGRYDVTIRATTPAEGGGPDVQRTDRQTFSVSAAPEVELLATGVSVAPEVTAVGRLSEFSVCVANRGFTATDSTRIVVWDESTHDTLGVLHVSIPAKDSTSARLLWTPDLPGTHVVRFVAEVNDATELDPENNEATLTVPVAALPATAGVDTLVVAPAEFAFAPPRPNPFRGHLTLEFTAPRTSRVAIEVFDILGRRVRRVLDDMVEPGRHTHIWKGDDNDGRSLPAGVYLVRFVSPGLKTTKRAVLIR